VPVKTFLHENVVRAHYNKSGRIMPRKPAIAKETAASAKPARAAKSSTPRVKAAQHSKVVPAVEKPVVEKPVVEKPVVEAIAETIAGTIADPVLAAPAVTPENAHEAIAKIAYSYWESRGCQGGTEIEDWVRAEHEYRQRTAASEPRALASGVGA
jgi:hypothetical protein